MRVTLEVKRRTHARLVEAVESLVKARGFDSVTTRDVAAAAGVGHGTLFNYFSSREALGLALCDVFLARAAADAARTSRHGEGPAEDLFALGAASLRRLRPLRDAAGTLLAGVLLIPEDAGALDPDAPPGQPLGVRRRFLDAVRSTAARHRPGHEPDAATLHLYASLFVGVVTSWSRDASPHQEDTLALLDQATRLFAAALDDAPDRHEEETP